MEELIEKFKNRENIAVIGATNKKNKYGYKVYKKLKRVKSKVFPINSNVDKIEKQNVYDDIKDIEIRIDAVSMIVNPKIGKKILEDINKLNINLVWFQPNAESNNLIKYCKDNNIEIIYGRCVLVEL